MANTVDFCTAYDARNWGRVFDSGFPIPIAANTPSDLSIEGFFHYTTLASSKEILSLRDEENKSAKNQNRYISLFASHFLYLNDGEELFEGLKTVREKLKEKRIILASKSSANNEIVSRLEHFESIFSRIQPYSIFNAPNHFILCFCSKSNLLSQWEWYGKECGIAIEFDLESCEYDGVYSFVAGNPCEPYRVSPYKVVYDTNKKNSIINTIIKQRLSSPIDVDFLAMRAIASASFMKHKGFLDEHEMRLMFSPLYYPTTETPHNAISRVQYREANGVMKPYMEIHVKHKDPGKVPIKSITVGPGHNQILVFNAMMKLIQSRFSSIVTPIPDVTIVEEKYYEFTTIDGIEVRRSTIPFRG